MLAEIKKDYIEKRKAFKRRILVCGGAGCISSHCGEVQEALKMSLAEHQLESEVEILVTGCMGSLSGAGRNFLHGHESAEGGGSRGAPSDRRGSL